jgi:hypothetical protein
MASIKKWIDKKCMCECKNNKLPESSTLDVKKYKEEIEEKNKVIESLEKSLNRTLEILSSIDRSRPSV